MTSGTRRHPRRRRRLALVDRIPLDRLGLIAGLLAWLAVGVPVAVAQLTGNSSPVDDVAWWWWSAYLAYGVLCVLGDNAAVQSRPRLLRLLLAVQVLLGLAVVSLGPEWGFTSVLLVISAVYAAYIMPFRGAMLLVAAQTLAVALLLLDGADPTYVWTTAFVYAGFQGFAVLMVETGLREAVARQRLAEVNAELQAAQALLADSTRSVERLRIARDLHDLVGHQLTALTLNLEAAAHHSQGAAAEHVQRSRAAAKALLADVRDVVSQLREPTEDLAMQLRALTESVPRPAVHLRMTPGLAVPEPERARALVRCVQEVVTNAVRHAAADNLWIEVSQSNGCARVQAWDDGEGAAEVRPGNGLAGMRERFEQLGGQVSFGSALGEGFRVEAVLPR